jgi:hypothetical protein
MIKWGIVQLNQWNQAEFQVASVRMLNVSIFTFTLSYPSKVFSMLCNKKENQQGKHSFYTSASSFLVSTYLIPPEISWHPLLGGLKDNICVTFQISKLSLI